MWIPIYSLLHRQRELDFRLSTFKRSKIRTETTGRWRSSDGPRNSVGFHQPMDRSFFTKGDLQYESDSDYMEPVGLSGKAAERANRPIQQSTLYFQCAHCCQKLVVRSLLCHRVSLLSLIPHSSHWPSQCKSPSKVLLDEIGFAKTSSSWRT